MMREEKRTQRKQRLMSEACDDDDVFGGRKLAGANYGAHIAQKRKGQRQTSQHHATGVARTKLHGDWGRGHKESCASAAGAGMRHS